MCEKLESHWPQAISDRNVHIVITGGEPMLQARNVMKLASLLKPHFIEVETNATIKPPAPSDWWSVDHYTCSPKLASSGNPEHKRYVPVALEFFASTNNSCFKFVVQNEGDIREIRTMFQSFFRIARDRIWLMPEGATRETVEQNSIQVIDWCKTYGYQYSPRLQLMVYDQATGV
jgi:organic radical activating enzyme